DELGRYALRIGEDGIAAPVLDLPDEEGSVPDPQGAALVFEDVDQGEPVPHQARVAPRGAVGRSDEPPGQTTERIVLEKNPRAVCGEHRAETPVGIPLVSGHRLVGRDAFDPASERIVAITNTVALLEPAARRVAQVV